MHPNGLKRTRMTFWRRDSMRLSVAIATLIGVLSALSVIVTPLFISDVKITGTMAKTAADLHQRAQAEAKARRTGSIVFVTRKKMCEELRFDNVAEQVLSVESVDCETRLMLTTAAEAQWAGAANMRSVLDSFKK